MTTNLVHNVKEAFQGFSVRNAYCWLDSTLALYWIRGNGEYKQFVGNRVRRIQEKEYIECRHVGTEKNPDDLGGRVSEVNQTSKLWWWGPEWLSEPENLPPDIITSVTKETKIEARTLKKIFRPVHGQVGSLESNQGLCVGIVSHAQHQKQPQKYNKSRDLSP